MQVSHAARHMRGRATEDIMDLIVGVLYTFRGLHENNGTETQVRAEQFHTA